MRQNRNVMYRSDYQARFNLLLKPCPFCASENIGLYLSPMPHITCMTCDADGPASLGFRSQAISDQYRAGLKWNERPVRP